jgi:hypothetical protein
MISSGPNAAFRYEALARRRLERSILLTRSENPAAANH